LVRVLQPRASSNKRASATMQIRSGAQLDAPSDTSSQSSDSMASGRCSGECKARVMRLAKKYLDYAPAILGIFVNWVDAIPICSMIVGVGVTALIVDFFVAQQKKLAGLPAIFPKLVPVVFVLSFTILLVLLCTSRISEDQFRMCNAAVMSGSLFIMAWVSIIIGQPFIYADAVEMMPAEKLQSLKGNSAEWEVFQTLMNTITKLWAWVFFLITCVNLFGGRLEAAGYKSASTVLGSVGPVVIILIALRCVQPRIIQKTKEEFPAPGP